MPSRAKVATAASGRNREQLLAQRSARRKARTKGRSGCRAPQEGAASAARTESVRAYCFGAAVCKTRGPHQGPKRMQGTARGRCFRCPNRERASLLFWRSGLQDARPAQGPKRMQGTARGHCFRCPNRERTSLLFWRSGLAGHRKRTYREGVTYHERPYQVSGRYPRVLCLL